MVLHASWQEASGTLMGAVKLLHEKDLSKSQAKRRVTDQAMDQTELLQPDRQGIARAADLLRAGSLVAFPTETVYGLGADARSGEAVARIYEAKKRPSFNPLIIHVSDLAQAQTIADFNDTALELAHAFWPGPLSLVLPLKEGHSIAELVLAGLDSVALRVPEHPTAQALLKAFAGPLAAPSANPSGRISPTEAIHVTEGLAGRIEAVLDGGPCLVGLESTIIDPGPPTCLLRPGGLSLEALENCLAQVLETAQPGKIVSPGQLASHYAPNAQVRLNETQWDPRTFRIGFGEFPGDVSLSATADMREAAARLFAVLHQADKDGRPISVAPVPEVGLGLAINDRLRRAAAPRD